MIDVWKSSVDFLLHHCIVWIDIVRLGSSVIEPTDRQRATAFLLLFLLLFSYVRNNIKY